MSERLRSEGIKMKAILLLGMPCPTPRQLENSLKKILEHHSTGDPRIARYERKLGEARVEFEAFKGKARELSKVLK
jgi:hypothetical protein